MNDQEIQEYLDERTGIRIYDGGQSEEQAVDSAKVDLMTLLEREENK